MTLKSDAKFEVKLTYLGKRHEKFGKFLPEQVKLTYLGKRHGEFGRFLPVSKLELLSKVENVWA